MGKMVLAGIFAMAASTSLAQTASDQAGAGHPANLCQELLAFMKAPPPEAATPAAPAKAAASAESKTAAPVKDAGAASGQADAPKPAGESASSQQVTGQSGPATDAPDPNAPQPAAKDEQNAPQKASVSAPVPTDGKSVSKDSVLSVADAEGLAGANDIAECKSAARELRLAGVAMPPPLLALAALDLQYHGD